MLGASHKRTTLLLIKTTPLYTRRHPLKVTKALRKERPPLLDLLVRQPKKVAYRGLLAEPESDCDAHIDRS